MHTRIPLSLRSPVSLLLVLVAIAGLVRVSSLESQDAGSSPNAGSSLSSTLPATSRSDALGELELWAGMSFSVSPQASPEKPKQTGMTEDDRFVHEDPSFAFFLPRKKPKKIAKIVKHWRIIDVKERLKALTANLDKQIAEEEKKNPEGTERLEQLGGERARIKARFKNRVLQLEVDGDMGQWMTIAVKARSKSDRGAALADAFKDQFSDWSGVKYHLDRDTSQKSDKKARRQCYTVELTGRAPKGKEALWVYAQFWTTSGKKGVPYVVEVLSVYKASKRDAKSKEFDILRRLLRWG